MSLKEEFALLSDDEQEAILAELDPEIVRQMSVGEWWWESRPEQVPPPGNWTIHLYLGGRGTGKTRSGAEWIVQRTEDYPLDASGFPAERLVMAYSLSDARLVCIEGPSGVIRVLERKGYEEVKDFYKGDHHLKFHYVKSPKPHITLLETGARIFFSGSEVDAARGLNLADVWCVAKDEPVLTADGPVAIQNVRSGDFVWTDLGFKEVLKAGITKKNAAVVRITTTDGELRVTPEHQVWINGDWANAGLVKPGDIMATCLPILTQSPQNLHPATNGTGAPGTATRETATTTAATAPCCTGAYGSRFTDPSRTGSMSITSTAIAGTTGFPTSKSSADLSICGEPGVNAPILTRLIPQPDPSAPQGDCWKCGHAGSQDPSSATSAESYSIPLECAQSGAGTNAATRRPSWHSVSAVLSAELESELTDVHDLTIADAAHFYAGSAMVKIHNCDEPIKWSDALQVWREGIRPALRADVPGDKPRAFVTTTPRPIAFLRELLKIARGEEKDVPAETVSTARGSTFDNKLNLSEDYLREVEAMYRDTNLGRQELYGEMTDDIDGALFSWAGIENSRVEVSPERVAHRTVGVDPGLTGAEDGDEMGVVVACRDSEDHIYVLADRTTRMAGRDAAIYAWKVFAEFGADTLVYESNLGKAWMQQVFTDAFRELQRSGIFPSEIANPPLVPVFSNQGKKLRAEPVAMRYSQGRVHHVGKFELLEKQMLQFDPITSKVSPDRLDALVHACRHLMSGERRRSRIFSPLHRKSDRLAHDQI